MTEGRFRAGVQPGEGVVARYGDVAVVVAPGGDAFTDALLHRVAAANGDPRALAWQVVALVAAHQPAVPPFALALGDRVVLHGTARAVVDGQEVTSGDVWTWTERPLAPHGSLAISVAPGPVVAVPRSDLRDGVLAGAGLVLEPMSVPTPVPTSVPTPEPTPAPAAIVAPPPPSVEDVGTTMARVRTQDTVHLADAIAALHADDGSRVPLDRDYVLGRDPRQDPAVLRGEATPIKVTDSEQLISRVHAYVAVTRSAVTVRDCGSANGTFVAAPGDPSWTRIGPDPQEIPIGHSIRLGLRVYTHVPADDAG